MNINLNKQQKFYSLPKRYKQIRRFEQRPFAGNCYLHWPRIEVNINQGVVKHVFYSALKSEYQLTLSLLVPHKPFVIWIRFSFSYDVKFFTNISCYIHSIPRYILCCTTCTYRLLTTLHLKRNTQSVNIHVSLLYCCIIHASGIAKNVGITAPYPVYREILHFFCNSARGFAINKLHNVKNLARPPTRVGHFHFGLVIKFTKARRYKLCLDLHVNTFLV